MTIITPVKGLRFYHARVLDNEALKRGKRKPALFEVSSIRRGFVFYGMVEDGIRGKSKDCCSLGQFGIIVHSVPQADDLAMTTLRNLIEDLVESAPGAADCGTGSEASWKQDIAKHEGNLAALEMFLNMIEIKFKG